MIILIQVGGLIGVIPTIALVLLTAVIGVHLLKQQGLSTLLRANEKMQQGAMPAQEMAEGLLLAMGGALLLTPGFFTDCIGFACLLPLTRQALVKKIIAKGLFVSASTYGQQNPFFQAAADDDVIDAEFTRDDSDRLK